MDVALPAVGFVVELGLSDCVSVCVPWLCVSRLSTVVHCVPVVTIVAGVICAPVVAVTFVIVAFCVTCVAVDAAVLSLPTVTTEAGVLIAASVVVASFLGAFFLHTNVVNVPELILDVAMAVVVDEPSRLHHRLFASAFAGRGAPAGHHLPPTAHPHDPPPQVQHDRAGVQGMSEACTPATGCQQGGHLTAVMAPSLRHKGT